jgi:(p)ppGpp synthase/HD superfamily hydrolase
MNETHETSRPPAFLSRRFDDALKYAAEAHRFQRRKDEPPMNGAPGRPGAPYIGHLLGVAGIVIDNGGTEDEAIAAVLHDAPEDQGGEPRLADIAIVFGDRVAAIVEGCSDSLTTDPNAKLPWRPRKERYIAHLNTCYDISVLLVSAADKLHNSRTTLQDLRSMPAASVWAKFNKAAGRDGTIWYYRQLIEAYKRGRPDARREPLVEELTRVIDAIEASDS